MTLSTRTAMPVMMRPVRIPMTGATRSHFRVSREYVAVRSSLTRAVYFCSSGCLRNLESRTCAKIPNAAILSLPTIGSTRHLALIVSSTMSRGGTGAATHVAEMPQANRCGTLTESGIRESVLSGTDIQRPNPGFAANRGFQSPSQHHTSARRMVPRHAIILTSTPKKWHGNWIIDRDFTRFRRDDLS